MQSGRVSILLLLITTVFGLGFAGSVYLNYNQFQKSTQDRREMQGTISDLRSQLHIDEKQRSQVAANGQPSNQSPTNSGVLSAQSINITELGVKLTTGDPISDLTYNYQLLGSYGVASLTTAKLVAKYPSCMPGSALGMIERRPLGSRPYAYSSKLLKQFGQFSYYYVPPQSNCGSNSAERQEVDAAKAALINTVLPTLSQ